MMFLLFICFLYIYFYIPVTYTRRYLDIDSTSFDSIQTSKQGRALAGIVKTVIFRLRVRNTAQGDLEVRQNYLQSFDEKHRFPSLKKYVLLAYPYCFLVQYNYLSTRHYLDVQSTSFSRDGRQMDVKKTFCAYFIIWERAVSLFGSSTEHFK